MTRSAAGPTSAAIGTRIRTLREERGWTQGDLAKTLGTDQKHVSRLELGQINVVLDELGDLAAAFGMPMVDFLEVE